MPRVALSPSFTYMDTTRPSAEETQRLLLIIADLQAEIQRLQDAKMVLRRSVLQAIQALTESLDECE